MSELGITTTVQCVTGVLEHAVKRIRAELLPKYPNVDDVVALTHSYGCGVAINARDAYIPIRTVRNLARNPNLGGEALVISLGCEKLQAGQVMHDNDPSVDLSEPWLYRLQDASLGFGEMIEQIMGLAETRLKKLDLRRRETVPASELILGMQCGGSDAFSGITANPALGYASDLLVRAGATVLFSEVTEVRDAIYMLTSRAENQDVADALVLCLGRHETCNQDSLSFPPCRSKRSHSAWVAGITRLPYVVVSTSTTTRPRSA